MRRRFVWLKDIDRACPVTDLAFSPDGGSLVFSFGYGGIGFCDLATYKETFFRSRDGGFLSIAFSPDGKFLAAGTEEGETRFLDLVNFSTSRVATSGQSAFFAAPSGYPLFICAGSDGHLYFCNNEDATHISRTN